MGRQRLVLPQHSAVFRYGESRRLVLSPGQEFSAAPSHGWVSFDKGQPMNLRAWSAADWPGIGEVQHVTIDAERGVLV